MIIDVDSHFEPGPAWLDDFPELRAKIPVHDTGAITTEILAGEILADVPRDEWPSVEHLVPPGVGMIVGTEERPEGYGYEGSGMHNTGDAAERIAWLDQNGIDAEAVICLEGMLNARFLEDRALAREIITTSNTWMADAVAGYTDRLFPTTCLDFSDVDVAIAEMTRMRERGSRAFLISTIPVPGVPMHHPQFDPIWSAATDLGMIAYLHVGYQPARFDPAWGNVAGNYDLLRHLAVSQGAQSIELMLNGMVFGGTFERHPEVTVLIAECGTHWFAGAVEYMDNRDSRKDVTASIYLGKYPYELKPSEFVRRNVRITPLPRRHQSPVRLLEEYPECVVFSTDYTHNEGCGTPLAYYDEVLAGVDADTKARFFGGNIAESYARMGDPLPV